MAMLKHKLDHHYFLRNDLQVQLNILGQPAASGGLMASKPTFREKPLSSMLRCTYIACLVDSYLCVSGRHLLIPFHTLVGPLLYTVYCTFSLSGDRLNACLTWNLIISNIKKKLSTQKTLNRPLYICNKPWSPTCPLWPTDHQLLHCGQLVTSWSTVVSS